MTAQIKAEAERRGLLKKRNRKRYSDWIPWEPTPKQLLFIEDDTPDILFGGAVGGAKSVALVMKALRWVDVPGYRALLCRESLEELGKAGALKDLMDTFLAGTKAKWSEKGQRWTFPSGATIEFSDLKDKRSLKKLWGASWAFIGIDEGQNIPEWLIKKLHARLRRSKFVPVPAQFCITANPGGETHEYLYKCYIMEPTPRHKYIPSRLFDNPFLDHEEYLATLGALDPLERDQLINGNWDAVPTGKHCKPDWFKVLAATAIPRFARHIRGWDPCWTGEKDKAANCLVAGEPGRTFVLDANELEIHITELRQAIQAQAAVDPKGTIVALEKSALSLAVVKELKDTGLWHVVDLNEAHLGYTEVLASEQAGRPKTLLILVPQTGDKLARASTHITEARHEQLFLREGPWNAMFIKRHARFTNTPSDIDDIIDAMSNARRTLTLIPTPKAEVEPYIIPGSVAAMRMSRNNARRR